MVWEGVVVRLGMEGGGGGFCCWVSEGDGGLDVRMFVLIGKWEQHKRI